MSNLNSDVKKLFDELIKNNSIDNVLQMYDNYTYHIELCMIPKDKMKEYEDILSSCGPMDSTMRQFFNKNKIILADTGGCPKFNIISARMKTYTQSGSTKTTKKLNVHINGYMVETVLTLQEVFGFTFMDKFDFTCAILGYQARHCVPVFLNIWFSGYENWNSELNSSDNNGQYMKRKECIGDTQYIYRGVLSNIKTTTSSSSETTYEITFSSDNYSTDNKCLDACFSYSKVIEIDCKTQNFLGDVAYQLERQINENFLLAQPTAVAQHIYDLKMGSNNKVSSIHKPVTFFVYDLDGSPIYKGYKNIDDNSPASFFSYMYSKALYQERFGVETAAQYKRGIELSENIYEKLDTILENSPGSLNDNIDIVKNQNDVYKNQKQLEEDYEKQRQWKKENRIDARKKQETAKQFGYGINKENQWNYGISNNSQLNKAITKNIIENPLITKNDNVIRLSCDGQTIDNIFNSILISCVNPIENKELGGLGACCNIIPHFLAEYEGKCYYNYDIEIRIIKIPGLEGVVDAQKSYLDEFVPNTVETPEMNYAMMQYKFLENLKDKTLKSYKYMYSGSDISVLEYNTDMSQLFYMETGTSLYKNLLFNLIDKNVNKDNNNNIQYNNKNIAKVIENIVKREMHLYKFIPKDIIFTETLKDKLLEKSKNGNIYMEDIWNAKDLHENEKFINKLMLKNYKNIAIGTSPIQDINDTSTGLLSIKKIAWNNIFNVACQTATLKIIGDPYWIVPNIPFTKDNKLKSNDSQTFPIFLFSYTPFVEQQDDDTFKINEMYNYEIPYMVTEINSIFENGQFIQELVCNLQPQFIPNTSMIEGGVVKEKIVEQKAAQKKVEEEMLKKKEKEENDKKYGPNVSMPPEWKMPKNQLEPMIYK